MTRSEVESKQAAVVISLLEELGWEEDSESRLQISDRFGRPRYKQGNQRCTA